MNSSKRKKGKQMFRENLRRTFWQVPSLIVLASLLSAGVNSWRADGIPLVGDWSEEARFSDTAGESMIIALKEARKLFERNDAVFLDARPPVQYAEGHIRGALNMPWPDVDRYFMELAERLDGASAIIAYCDGETCDLSHELALFLKDMGFADARVLVNGWTIWKQAGLPAEKGEMKR